jgi:phosphonate transport system ATP-binding protein
MLIVENLGFSYDPPNNFVIRNINLDIAQDRPIALIGPSGAGKTTLLKCIDRLLKPQTGKIVIDGCDIWDSKSVKQSIQKVTGMIFQEYGLVDSLSTLENVLLGSLMRIPKIPSLFGLYPDHEINFALACLELVGIKELCHRPVSHLSGGQRQRVSIARVLAQKPKVMLADEPVSNLDPVLREQILKLLVEVCNRNNILLILSLHQVDLAQRFAEQIIALKKGNIVYHGPTENISREMLAQIYE